MDFCRRVFDGELMTGLKSGYTNKPLCGFQTKSLHIDESFRKCIFDDRHKKRISEIIFDYVTKRTLAMWYMDDGSLQISHKKPYIRLHTESFSREEHLILQDVLYRKFGINSVVDSYRKYYRLRFNQKDTRRFLEEIDGLIHPSMAHKMPSGTSKFKLDNYTFWKMPDISVSRISEVVLGTKEQVYNLEVTDNQNFFADKMLVHNCQNSTPEQMRMVLTRLGEGSKIVLCGDVYQTDINAKNGLSDAFELLQDTEGVGFVVLTHKAIMRHPVIEEIENRYTNRKSQKKNNQ